MERLAQQGRSGPSSREIRLRELIFGLAKIQSHINGVRKALEKPNAPSYDDRLEVFKKWAREVGRYSFRSHLIAEVQFSDRP